ncbi:MAG: SPFH/Band 7/PHB domain protein [Gammaproteobacteria bacterium]|nr:SPFH/Band 7/PHB domain protein [Gammaproteobacteria bacterium]
MNFLISTGTIIAIVIVFVVLFAIFASSIRVVKQTEKFIVERLGKFKTILEPGFRLIAPFIDRVASRVTMKEQIRDFDPQPVITKDNVTMQIDTIVFFQITDPKLYTYGVVNPIAAIESLSATTLRNIIGELDLDETLTSRDIINTKMRAILDEATDPWGIKVNRVEVKNILPPKDIRDAMERQMRAEREKREQILLAEGQRQSQILKAEGEKQSQILKAEGEKEAVILKAEAEKEARIRVAEGEAKAIIQRREAESQGLKMLKDAGADEAVLKLKSYEALEKVANGQATKLIVPSNLQDLTSTAVAVKEAIQQK